MEIIVFLSIVIAVVAVLTSIAVSYTHLVIYGYLWDEKREHWLVDEEAAEVVRRIFSLTLEGLSLIHIYSTKSNPIYFSGKSHPRKGQ